ncbi:MAG: right-handed parallel beta-helix repeat-containing protein [Anaerolineales bacterium]|nr:right-handed parallel beta-helix repeat-containing protein [Anaerolineales bacterium]
MRKSSRLSIWTYITLFVLIVSAVRPPVAYADDGDTPATPEATEVVVTDEAPPLDSTEAANPSEEVPAPAPTENTADQTPDAETPLLASLPEDTNLVVLDEDGEALSLASQQAADAIAVNDPIWCPAGSSPIAGSGGCTASYVNLASLINDIVSNNISQPAQAGTIWITSGADTSPTGTITLNGSSLSTWADYALTIQGGWDGSAAGTIVGQTNFQNKIGLAIVDWNANITINNLTLRDTINTDDSLNVGTSGNITLNSVTVRNNDSANGASLEAGGNINVNDSTFNNNSGGLGAELTAIGDITVANSQFTNNDNGALLISGGDISISDSTFRSNAEVGLTAFSLDGSIDILNATVNNNGETGAVLAVLNNGDISITDSSFSNNATLSTATPLAGGLTALIMGAGSIDLSGVNVIGNQQGDGAVLGASNGDIVVSDSRFNGNQNGNGLYADSANGSIVVNNSSFVNNGQSGLLAVATDTITVNCGEARRNGEYGVEADSPSLELNGVTFNNNTSGNYTNTGSIATATSCTPSPTPTPTTPVPSATPTTPVPSATPVPTSSATPSAPEITALNNEAKIASSAWQIIRVDGIKKDKQTLNCVSYLGAIVILPNQDRVILPCGVGEQVTLTSVAQDQLPKSLDDSFSFVSAFNAQIFEELRGKMRVNFFVPADKKNDSYVVLFWDKENAKWLELDGAFNDEGFFEAASKFDGIFVLAKK